MAADAGPPDVFAVEGVDDLFGVDPSEFVARRDALAKDLRARGDKAAAQAVKGLRRPTVVAWGLNQVARRDPGRIEELAEAGAALRHAYESMLAGAEADLDGPTQRRRRIVRDLSAEVARLVGEGHRAAAAGSLEAASVDDATLSRLRAGHLSAEVEPPSGFGFGDVPVAAAPKRKSEGPTPAERRRAVQSLARAESDLDRAAASLERAEARLRSAQEAVAEREEELAEARRRRDEAQEALDQLGAG